VIVLGVDPGTLVTGYGVVAQRPSGTELLTSGVISNSSREALPDRLKRIHAGLLDIIWHYRPTCFAIESAFYGKNAQSALKLGHARGVSLLAAVTENIPTAEYTPREVKKAIVGTGTATKEQVQHMVRVLLRLPEGNMILDASDAIAIALCHLHRTQHSATKSMTWKAYIAAHPERVQS
jgi:crossover junction endodeoxyribonuclease RuvC